ncbi:hypothetical protein GDO81_012843 [Engystomops pustulosus]|uniref:Uncharacterized protein n=1 Tax=Engystomops pustulosus TaxID=76066 RepID=A0AAV7AXF9_ENGPU|nr:hypothetical protein GDO81_012843 [Engystomops pustulosus]
MIVSMRTLQSASYISYDDSEQKIQDLHQFLHRSLLLGIINGFNHLSVCLKALLHSHGHTSRTLERRREW